MAKTGTSMRIKPELLKELNEVVHKSNGEVSKTQALNEGLTWWLGHADKSMVMVPIAWSKNMALHEMLENILASEREDAHEVVKRILPLALEVATQGADLAGTGRRFRGPLVISKK